MVLIRAIVHNCSPLKYLDVTVERDFFIDGIKELWVVLKATG